MTDAETLGARRAAQMTARAAVPTSRRMAVALALVSVVGLLAFGWPVLAEDGSVLGASTDAPLVLGLVLAGALVVVAVGLGDGSLDVKALALLGLLSALGALLRPIAGGTAGVETVFVVIVLGARALGPGFGFVLGSTTLCASALLTGGVGPWLPFQMLGASWVGLGVGLVPRRLRGAGEVAALAAYSVVAALGFGLAMNLSFWPFQVGGETALSFVAGDPVGDNLRRFLVFSLATSLAWDVGRAITTALGVAVLGRPVLATLRRAATRASFARPGRAGSGA